MALFLSFTPLQRKATLLTLKINITLGTLEVTHFAYAKPGQRVHSLSDCSNIACVLRTFNYPSAPSLGGISSGGGGGGDVCFLCLQFVSKAQLCGTNSSLGVMDSYNSGHADYYFLFSWAKGDRGDKGDSGALGPRVSIPLV